MSGMNGTQPAHRPAIARHRHADSGLDCQVLIVGAGPTGLVLGAELLARGIRTRIIDKADGVALNTRAIGLHARTLEVLDTMGLAERFIERGQVANYLRFYSEARCLVSLEFARSGSRFGFLLDLPQDETERLLRARISELGGVIEQRAELAGLTARGDAVTADIRGPQGRAGTITAGFVVGCDGAHSRSGTSSAWPSKGTPTRRTGCSPTSGWTPISARTRRTCSSGPTGCR